jgi:mannosyltransferase
VSISERIVDSAVAPPATGSSTPVAGAAWWRTDRALTVAALAGPCLLALILTSIDLSTRSFWLDEGATVAIASQHGSALWSAIAHDGGNMLAYYLVQHVVIGWFGDAAAVIRLPSMIATVATVALIGLLGRRLFDRRVGFVAGLLGAVSLPLVFWGQDARGYAPLIALVAGSFLAYIYIVETPDERPVSRGAVFAYVACIVLAAYMGFVGALVVPAQLLLLAWRRDRVRVVLGAVAVAALLCIPLLVLAKNRGSSQLFWVPSPDAKGIGQMLRWVTSSGLPPNFHHNISSTIALIVSLIALAWVARAIALRLTRGSWRAPDHETWAAVLLLAWLVVPIALSLGESASGQPILLYRNSVICLPAVALLLAWGLFRTSLPVVASWAGVAVLIGLRAAQLAPTYAVSPEDWKAAERYVVAGARAGDCIAFYPLDGRMPFDLYVRANGDLARAPVPVSPVTPWSRVRPFVEDYDTPPPAQLSAIEARCPRVWFVASHQGQRNGPPGSRSNYLRYRALQATLQEAYAHHDQKIFGWAGQVRVELISGARPRG